MATPYKSRQNPFFKFFVVIGLFVLFSGCSGEAVNVTLNIVPQGEVLAVATADGHSGIDPRNGESLGGYTLWDGQGNCDIFIVPMEFCEDEWTWNALLGDELRHCFFGDYHE